MVAEMVKLEESRARFLAVRSSYGLEVVFKQILEVVERNEQLRSSFFNYFHGSYDSKCKELGRVAKEHHSMGVLPTWDEEEWVSSIHLLLSENALIWDRLPAACKEVEGESSGEEGESTDGDEASVDPSAIVLDEDEGKACRKGLEVEDDTICATLVSDFAGGPTFVPSGGFSAEGPSFHPTSMAAHGRVAGDSVYHEKRAAIANVKELEVEDDDMSAMSPSTLEVYLSKVDTSESVLEGNHGSKYQDKAEKAMPKDPWSTKEGLGMLDSSLGSVSTMGKQVGGLPHLDTIFENAKKCDIELVLQDRDRSSFKDNMSAPQGLNGFENQGMQDKLDGANFAIFGQAFAAMEKATISASSFGNSNVSCTNMGRKEGIPSINSNLHAQMSPPLENVLCLHKKETSDSVLGNSSRKTKFPFPDLDNAGIGGSCPQLIATKLGPIGDPKSPPRAWAGLFKSTTKAPMKLGRVELGAASKSKKLPMKSSMGSNMDKWATYLVGYFLGKAPAYSIVCNVAFNKWKKKGLQEVLATDSGFFFFRFDSLDNREIAFEEGSWDCFGQPIFLRKWHQNLKLEKETKRKVPIWVKFFNMPLEYWNAEGFSRVGSMIGNPLCVDSITESCKRISFAHIYIEIDVDSELLSEFDLVVEEEGRTIEIKIDVQYKWIPPKCSICKCFGHNCEKPNRPTPATTESLRRPTAKPSKPKATTKEWVVATFKKKGHEQRHEEKELKDTSKPSYFAILEDSEDAGPSQDQDQRVTSTMEDNTTNKIEKSKIPQEVHVECGNPNAVTEVSEDDDSIDMQSTKDFVALKTFTNRPHKNGSNSLKKKKGKQKKKK